MFSKKNKNWVKAGGKKWWFLIETPSVPSLAETLPVETLRPPKWSPHWVRSPECLDPKKTVAEGNSSVGLALHGGFSVNGGNPHFTPQNDHVLVGKPMDVGYHHFRKPLHKKAHSSFWFPYLKWASKRTKFCQRCPFLVRWALSCYLYEIVINNQPPNINHSKQFQVVFFTADVWLLASNDQDQEIWMFIPVEYLAPSSDIRFLE